VFGAVREAVVGSGAETVGFSGGIGHITDLENSLVYMRARYYDPSLGRFISEDPGCNGTNWYIYCQNNPVNGVDPSGQISWTGIGAAVGAFLWFSKCLIEGDSLNPLKAPTLIPLLWLTYIMANPSSPLFGAVRALGQWVNQATSLPGGSVYAGVIAGYALFLDFAMDWLFDEGVFEGDSDVWDTGGQ
jgi:RHS repeat-associated protein